MKSRLPMPVKIISVLLVVWALYSLVVSIIGIFGAFSINISDLQQKNPERWSEIQTKAGFNGIDLNESTIQLLVALGSFLYLLFSGFVFLLGIALWKRKNWARVTTIVFAYIMGFFSFMAVFVGDLLSIIDFLVGITIGTYLLVNKEAKRAFKK